MKLFKLIVSALDRERIIAAIERARNSWVTYAPYLDLFRAKLRRAVNVHPDEVPGDMITMNSRFALVDQRTGEFNSYTLVYPEQEAPLQSKLSVLSPMGQAIYGARVGDKVLWRSTAGREVAMIQELHYQPEAAGDHHL